MNPIKWLALVLLASIVAGCAAEKISMVPKYPAPPVNQPVNEYYYYMEAQLFKDKNMPAMAIAFMQRAVDLDPESFFLKKELVFMHVDAKAFDKAAEIMQTAIARDPKNVEALVILGSIRQELNQEEEAIRLYETSLEIDPERENIYLVLGNLYTGREDFNNAIRLYRKLIQVHADSYAGHFFLARCLTAVGQIKEAEKEFNTTLRIRPDLIEPRFELLDLYVKKPSEFKGMNLPSKIISMYRDILAEQPGNTRAAVELGLYYHENGMAADAAKQFLELGRRSDKDADISRFIARQYIENGQYKRAIVLIEGMLKSAADKAYLYYLCGFAHDNLDDKQKALDYFKQVPPDSRFFRESAFRIAYIYHELGQSAESIRYLNTLIARDPSNTEFMLYLGIIHEEMEQYEKAEHILQKAIELAPDSSNLNFRLGVVYDKWGKKEESIERMKIAIQLDPEDPNALNYLGYTYAELGRNLDEAESFILKALQIKPDDGYITDSLGWVYFQKGQYDKALETLERAVGIVGDDPVLLEHLGDAYEKTGRFGKAIEFYERALKAGARKEETIKSKIKQIMNRGF